MSQDGKDKATGTAAGGATRGPRHHPATAAAMGDSPGWGGERRWVCTACGFTVRYHVEAAKPRACPVCPINDAAPTVLAPGTVDSAFGRYNPRARMKSLARGPWHCDVCNAVQSDVPMAGATAEGPLCPVCQRRAALDAGAQR